MQCLLETHNLCLCLLREGFLEDVMPDMKLKGRAGVTPGKEGGVIGIPEPQDSRSLFIKVRLAAAATGNNPITAHQRDIQIHGGLSFRL